MQNCMRLKESKNKLSFGHSAEPCTRFWCVPSFTVQCEMQLYISPWHLKIKMYFSLASPQHCSGREVDRSAFQGPRTSEGWKGKPLVVHERSLWVGCSTWPTAILFLDIAPSYLLKYEGSTIIARMKKHLLTTLQQVGNDGSSFRSFWPARLLFLRLAVALHAQQRVNFIRWYSL